MSQPQAKNVAIIGGGLAGLAAAVKLTKLGIPVTLFEAGSQLGGRARSVAVEFNSRVVQLDNGQHIMLGAYKETLELLTIIGVEESQVFKRLPLKLDSRSSAQQAFPSSTFQSNTFQTSNFQSRTFKSSAFKLSAWNFLPTPLHLLAGLLFCTGLRFSERFAVIKFLLTLKKIHYQLPNDQPLMDFLRLHHQPSQVISLLWEPLCLAALNTPVLIASAQIFLNVLKDSFNHKKTDSDFLLPTHDLSQIFSKPITRYLHNQNATIHLNQRVKTILPIESAGEPQYVITTQNKQLQFSHVIIAVSPSQLQKFTENLPKLNTLINKIGQYHYQPIVTIYLQYASHATISSPMLGLTGTVSQWVFDRGILCNQPGLMAVIISAEGSHQKLTHDALALKVAQELHDAFPHLNKPLWHKVIAEKRATFSCTVDLYRPRQITTYTNVFLAGDYTYSYFPATIEGAVRSGFACGDLIDNP